eukprot:SAG11_NODE_30988_length_295_cov_5.372449_1_plen_21_part_10
MGASGTASGPMAATLWLPEGF